MTRGKANNRRGPGRSRRGVAAAGVAALAVLALNQPPAWTANRADQSAREPNGQHLYDQNCASCHGSAGEGTQRGPSLVGVGPAALDFYLTTGRMPPTGAPTSDHRAPAFTPEEIAAIVGYAASFTGKTPAIPEVRPENSQRGLRLYLTYCAACHSAQGVGGALTGGQAASALDRATPTQIGEAIRVGPGVMPAFTADVLTDVDINAIAAYIGILQERDTDRGGLDLGRIGPLTEGAVAWIVGLGTLLLVVRLLGRRAE
ncbi:MAG: c-type cytochrome [Micromonosporaceae bacterium]|nr:c-type cytochrome [Micromonosporaceae bacterium]